MSALSKLRIRGKLMAVTATITLALSASLVTISLRDLSRVGSELLATDAVYLANLGAQTVQAAVQYNMADDITKVLKGLVGNGADVSLAAVIVEAPGQTATIISSQGTLLDRANKAVDPTQLISHGGDPQVGVPVIIPFKGAIVAVTKIDITANKDIKAAYLMVGVNLAKLDAKLKSQGTILLAVGAFVFLIGLVASYLLAVGIARPLASATTGAVALATGDLTIELDRKGQTRGDEAGDLLRALQKMKEDLTHSVGRIDTASGSLQVVGADLGRSIAETTTSSGAISQAVEAINASTETQAAGVTETQATIDHIVKNIEGLRARIEEQSTAVNNSSSAIEQMLSNIQSVSKTMDMMGQEFRALMTASDEGKKRLAQVSSRVSAVDEKSKRLRETNEIIQGIASQTNLLAMNAAIEAAHAGSSGKGFSVVADEIRKLAEQSANQSSEIRRDIGAIFGEIEDVVAAVADSERAFATVLDKIAELDRFEREVNESMREQTAGSKQILEAVGRIREVTTQVEGGSLEIAEGSRVISQEMRRLAEGTNALASSMARIASEAGHVRGMSENLDHAGKRTAEQITALHEVVSHFKLTAET